MNSRYDEYSIRFDGIEGGYVNNPKDPGGATNHGITIGTARQVGLDLDGDGDTDLIDLKMLTAADARKIFKVFYADPIKADLLPVGLDYATVDFSINSGPARPAAHLQRILGVEADGHIGPKTLATLKGKDVVKLINALCDSRLAFMKQARHKTTGALLWDTFGKGWQRRVDEVRADAIRDATTPRPAVVSVPVAPPALPGATRPAPVVVPSHWEMIKAIFKSFLKGK